MNMEISLMGHDKTCGLVVDYTEQEIYNNSTFKEIPQQNLDLHVGSLLFAHVKAQFKSVELRQYRGESDLERELRRKSEVSF